MSTCLSSRACGFNHEHMIKWPSCTSTSRTTASNSSSPSSTLSESTNSQIAISTKKPRKPRKRPNQTYNEAAALLFMACPTIFTTEHLTKSTPNHNHSFFNEPPELIENQGLQQISKKPFSLIESKVANSCQKTGEVDSNCVCVEVSDGCLDDFDTESILDEEIEQGIDCIMGDSNPIQENNQNIGYDLNNTCYGYPIGLGFGVRNGLRALRNHNDRNWCSPMVDVGTISQEVVTDCEKSPPGKKKNTKKMAEELMKSESELGDLSTGNGNRLMLRLDYDGVMNSWMDKGCHCRRKYRLPHLREAISTTKSANSESSVTRSMDKNHFKKISDRRPRCKGRFVKKQSSTVCYEET